MVSLELENRERGIFKLSTISSSPILSLKSTTGQDFFCDNLIQFHVCLHTSENKSSQQVLQVIIPCHRKNTFLIELECGFFFFLHKFLNILEDNLLFVCTDGFCSTFPIVNSAMCALVFSTVGLVLWNVAVYAQLFIQLWHIMWLIIKDIEGNILLLNPYNVIFGLPNDSGMKLDW